MTDDEKKLLADALTYLEGMERQSGYSDHDLGVVCCYRTEDGRRCVAGFLIADKFYREELEGSGAHQSNVITAIRKSHPEIPLSEEFFSHVQALQAIHDNTSNWGPDGFRLGSFHKDLMDRVKSAIGLNNPT